MSDLRLDRAERNALFSGIIFPENHLHGGQFRRVARTRAGAVPLDKTDRFCRVARIFVSAAHGECLTRGAGCINRFKSSVARCSDARNRRVNIIAVAFCVFQSFQNQHADALADEHAVGSVAEGADISRFGESRRFGKGHVHKRRIVGIDAAGEHHIGASFDQFAQRHFDSGKRSRAGRIYYGVNAAEVETVGNSARNNVAQKTRKRVFIPPHVSLFYLINDVRNVVFGNARSPQGAFPNRILQSRH